MRAEPFLNLMRTQRFGWERTAVIASNQRINGGWEIWMQVEIADWFLALDNQNYFEREKAYVGRDNQGYARYDRGTGVVDQTNNLNAASKCDFFISRIDGKDPTYMELKTVNYARPNPLTDVWVRFGSDVSKTSALSDFNGIPAIALIATFGTFDEEERRSITDNYRNPFIWDCENNIVTRVRQVELAGNPRLFIGALG